MEKYEKLDRTANEDIEAVREYAKARNEIRVLTARIQYLNELVDENDHLASSVWTTAPGECIPIADVEDDHLKNIVTHLQDTRRFNTRIAKEYNKRFGEMPSLPSPEDFPF